MRPRFASLASLAAALLIAGAPAPSLAKKTPKSGSKPAAGSSAPAAPSGPQPRLIADPDQVRASESLTWNTSFRLFNTLDVGLYSDSVRCRYEDTGPGETGVSRVQEVSFPGMAQAFGALSAGDSVSFNYGAPALFETGRVTFRLYTHRGDGVKYVSTATFEVQPGPISEQHPSEFLTVDGKKVETVFFESNKGNGSPGVLLVHGEGSQARALFSTAIQLSNRGYHVLMVSMPGYGQSEGPADLMGPHTLAAAGAALDRLKRTPGVDSLHLGAWGISRGATVAAGLAAQRSDLGCVIAQSGIYDLQATYRGTKMPGFREAIVAEAGSDSAGWKERSPIVRIAATHTPILVLHGENDTTVPADQAHAYANALKTAGVAVESSFFPGAGHELTPGLVTRPILIFLEATLHH